MDISRRFNSILFIAALTCIAVVSFPLNNYASNKNFSTPTIHFFPNPMLRTCNIVGGTSVVIKNGKDEILLCQIASSYIGSLELFLLKTEKKSSESIHYFLSGETDTSHCKYLETVPDLENSRTLELCFFSDGSIIDTATFEKGHNHKDNQAFKNVLSSSSDSTSDSY